MLACGAIAPRKEAWRFTPNAKVDMTEWRFAKPTATTLLGLVIATYLLFSPIGVAGDPGVSTRFVPLLGVLVLANAAVWAVALRRRSA